MDGKLFGQSMESHGYPHMPQRFARIVRVLDEMARLSTENRRHIYLITNLCHEQRN